jgi:hypothetical protein
VRSVKYQRRNCSFAFFFRCPSVVDSLIRDLVSDDASTSKWRDPLNISVGLVAYSLFMFFLSGVSSLV